MSDSETIEARGDAKTWSGVPQRREFKPPSGKPARYAKPSTIKEIAPVHKLLSSYMVEGCPSQALASKVGINAFEPMTLMQAAKVLRLRARFARWITAQPVWAAHHASELKAFREGHKAEALRTVVDIMRDLGENKAADRKVRLTAAAMIGGDAVTQQNQTNINVGVGVNVGVAVTPGYVIDLSGSEHAVDTIDVTPNRGED